MRTCCYTSFTLGYLPRALVLLDTLRAAQPDWAVAAVLVDAPPPGQDRPPGLRGFNEVLSIHDLPIPRVRSWLFGHGLVEACTAVKAAALLHLLDEGWERVVYLDPDVAVFHPLAPALDGEGASILLTPHQTEPHLLPAALQDNEMASLRFGVFNLGFLSVLNDPNGRRFAAWWAAQLHAACFDLPEHGLFTDQKYFDLVPCLFAGVGILRDPGLNVASWNIGTRRLRIGRDGGMTANGAPLRFCHFTKVGGIGDVMLDRYAGDALEPREIWAWYRRAVAARPSPVPPGWWHYGWFSDGTPVTPAMRLLYRTRTDLVAAFEDPFQDDPPGFLTWLRSDSPELVAEATRSASGAP